MLISYPAQRQSYIAVDAAIRARVCEETSRTLGSQYFFGAFAEGYQIGRIDAEPSTIAISGPSKRVEAVEAAITDPVDASGTIDRATFVRHAYVSDPLVQVMNPNPVRVTVIMEKVPGGTGGR